MKKKILSIVITVALLTLCAFVMSGFCSEKANEKDSEIKVSQQEPLSLTECEKNIYEVYEIPKDSIYYNYESISDLVYYRETGDTATDYIANIHCTEHGTAGSSYKIARSAYLFILLSKMEISELSNLSSYLDEMTALQRDFLSYQLTFAFEYALGVANKEKSSLGYLQELSADEEVYANVKKHELVDFMYFMQQLLEEKGNRYEWEKLEMESVV